MGRKGNDEQFCLENYFRFFVNICLNDCCGYINNRRVFIFIGDGCDKSNEVDDVLLLL